jgi:hypothetical protein
MISGIDYYSDVMEIFSLDNQEDISATWFEATQRYYQTSQQIIIPENKVPRWQITQFLVDTREKITKILSRDPTPVVEPVLKIDYISAVATSDVLDDAITEKPIELQIITPKTVCIKTKNLNNQIHIQLNELLKEDLNMGSLADKQGVKKYLLEQVAKQREVLSVLI